MIRPSIRIKHPNWTTELVRDYTGAPDTPVALESLVIKWGREEWLDDRKPTSAEFRILVNDDAVRTTANLFRYRQEIPVTITAAGMTLFDGFISEVRAHKTTGRDTERYIFDVTAMDRTTELYGHKSYLRDNMSNIIVAVDMAADDYLPQFKEKHKNLVGTLGKFSYPAERSKLIVIFSPYDLADSSIWTYISRFYRSMNGLGWEWDPATHEIFQQVAPRGLEGIVSILAHSTRGVEIVTDASKASESNDVIDLDADSLRIDEIGFTIPQRMDVGFIDFAFWTSKDNPYYKEAHRVFTVGPGTRTVSMGGINAGSGWEPAMKQFGQYVNTLGQFPKLPPVTFRFQDLDQKARKWWLTTVQRPLIGLIQNSALAEWLAPTAAYGADGYSPAVAAVGGVIEFNGSEWTVQHNLELLPANSGPADNPVTYSTLNESRYKIGDYSPNTAWREFAALPQHNTLKEK
ncbi:hypothetical protein [Corynebacterium striatum]|uniref:hypothetical protein n=1 Tax=Corynebacterium striatum TaxID=43770 RepID=UPI003B59AFF8